MSNFDSSLSECFGFSQMIISEFFKVSVARKLISPKFPIGVETMYNPLFIIFFLGFFILLASCAPVKNIYNKKSDQKNTLYEGEPALTKIEKKQSVILEQKEKEV